MPILKNKKDGNFSRTEIDSKHMFTSKLPISNIMSMHWKKSFDFDPKMDVYIGDFVGKQASQSA